MTQGTRAADAMFEVRKKAGQLMPVARPRPRRAAACPEMLVGMGRDGIEPSTSGLKVVEHARCHTIHARKRMIRLNIKTAALVGKIRFSSASANQVQIANRPLTGIGHAIRWSEALSLIGAARQVMVVTFGSRRPHAFVSVSPGCGHAHRIGYYRLG